MPLLVHLVQQGTQRGLGRLRHRLDLVKNDKFAFNTWPRRLCKVKNAFANDFDAAFVARIQVHCKEIDVDVGIGVVGDGHRERCFPRPRRTVQNKRWQPSALGEDAVLEELLDFPVPPDFGERSGPVLFRPDGGGAH